MVGEYFILPNGIMVEFNNVGMVGEVSDSRRTQASGAIALVQFYYFNIYLSGKLGAQRVIFNTEFEAKAVREVFCSQLAEYLGEHPIDEYSVDEY